MRSVCLRSRLPCCCHADSSPLSNDGSPHASVPIALERAGAPVVHVRVLRLAYPAKGVVEERRCRITKSARDLDAERDEDGVVVPKHLVELRDVDSTNSCRESILM